MSPGRRILVVDDDPMVATTVQRVLRPEGYDVDVALSGAQALEQARAQRPDLVVLDLMMPGIDGLEVCRQLRATSELPVLMLTARGEQVDKLRGFEAGLLRSGQEGDRRGVLRCLEARVLRCFSQCGERPAGPRDAAYVGDGRLTPQ